MALMVFRDCNYSIFRIIMNECSFVEDRMENEKNEERGIVLSSILTDNQWYMPARQIPTAKIYLSTPNLNPIIHHALYSTSDLFTFSHDLHTLLSG